MKEIILTQGKVAIVDDEDFDYLSQFKWCVMKARADIYAVARIGNKVRLMHRFLLRASKGQEIDHINHNTLDNRRSNLRVCTRKQNASNKKKIQSKSGYKGVSYRKQIPHWESYICCSGKKINIGYYDTAIEAARAYDKEAVSLFGEFAFLNFKTGEHDGFKDSIQ